MNADPRLDPAFDDDDEQEHGDPVRGLGVALVASLGFWGGVVLMAAWLLW